MEQESVYRKMLVAAVSNILLEQGFDTCDKESLGCLTEMLQCFLNEIGSVSKNYCELSGRNEPLIADVILGFVEMGFDFSGLEKYVKSQKHGTLPSLQIQPPQKQPSMLHAGTKQQLPSHIPQHLPPFPDPHAYIRTPTHKQPVIDYEAIREKAAIQKKDIERALTKFLARTNPTHNLFDNDESNIFPLIACKPVFPPYLNALLPLDQVFDPEDLEYDPKTQDHGQVPKKRQKLDNSSSNDNQNMEDNNGNVNIKTDEKEAPNWEIDNPYLAATKMPARSEL